MRRNSPIRLATRRKGALERRTADLARWNSELAAAPEETKGDLQAKVDCATVDVAALTKKIGSRVSYND